MANIWGGDKPVIEAAGDGLKDYVFPGMTAFWATIAKACSLFSKSPNCPNLSQESSELTITYAAFVQRFT